MIDDTLVWPMALQLASCLCRQIADARLPEPCFCGVLGGAQVAADYCSPCGDNKCGMAWVRVRAIHPVDTMSRYARMDTRCHVLVEPDFEVGVIRCAPTMGPNGEPPDMPTQLAASRLQMADMAAAMRAIVCCFEDREVNIGLWTPIGPEGDCLGGAWTAVIGTV